ncbi:MAG: L-threonylcarbamoyladenylate synthase [bacterium]|nr:L-threonylcarbamoyladenylate synthase [bacterium]
MQIKINTELIKLTKANREATLARATDIIKSGGLVVFPTETVYGLGANVFDEEALKKIFEAKGRPSDNPIIVHVATREQLLNLVESISVLEQELIDNFWPGPLTVIIKKKKDISNVLSGGLDTIAVRMSSHHFVQDLILSLGAPIAAPSANISGRPSGTTGEHAYEDLKGRVDLIIDDGISEIGLESTVVKVVGNSVLILRAGAITKEMIEQVMPETEVFFATEKKDLNASPGTRYRHYAPKAPLEIVSPDKMVKYVSELEAQGKKVGVITTTQNEKFLKSRGDIFIIGSQDNLKEISQSFYQALRFFDDHPVDVILCESFREEGIGIAIMDRLKKATGAW